MEIDRFNQAIRSLSYLHDGIKEINLVVTKECKDEFNDMCNKSIFSFTSTELVKYESYTFNKYRTIEGTIISLTVKED